MIWTTTEDQLLVKLWGEGLSSTLIANEIGKTRNAVIGRIHRLREAGVQLDVRGRVMPKKAPRPKPKEKPKPEKIIPSKTLASSLIKLRANQCRWPLETTFCDANRDPGYSYCSHHRQISFRPIPPRERVR